MRTNQLLEAYSSEFNGPLDPNKWATTEQHWGRPFWSWAEDHVRVEKNALRIKMSHAPHVVDGATVQYKSGILKNLSPPILYGYFEARIKAASVWPGVCPAFWLYNNHPRHWTEIDIAELTNEINDPKVLAATTHVWKLLGETEATKTRQGRHRPKLGFDPRDEYHVYGLEWTKESVIWYVDNQAVACEPNIHLHQPLWVTLSMGLRAPLRDAPSGTGFPTEMSVDYLRTWSKKP